MPALVLGTLEARGSDHAVMHRTLNLFLLLAALASAIALYVLKYDTRRMEARVLVLERTVQEVEGEIARLRAEHAHLARPERLEPLARALGLAPISRRQYLRIGTRPAESATSAPTQR
jgi:cell division protein FtsL